MRVITHALRTPETPLTPPLQMNGQPLPYEVIDRAEARVAVELDGAQHLASAEAYRRDRRKDLLLQEAGYFVLRFLAEDVGKNLDAVLDAILRTLTHCRKR